MYLSPEQRDLIPQYKEKWMKIGLSTDPMDIEAAIHHLGNAYKAAKLTKPAACLFYSSPLEGSYVAAYLKKRYFFSILKLILHIRENKLQTKQEIIEAADLYIDKFYKPRTRSLVLSMDQQKILSEVLLERARREIDPKDARNELSNAMFGQHEAGWLGFYETLRDFGVKDCRRLTPMIEFAKCAGWTWCYEDIAIITDRPLCFHRDDFGRPHRLDGPALAYRDGTKLYAIHGVKVPAFVVEDPKQITAEMISHQSNVEVRRVMLDRFGWSRYLEESGATLIDSIEEDQASNVEDIRLARLYRNGLRGARLYRKEIPGDEPLVMVRLMNSTPEPDGSIKPYLLRVPPGTKTCLEAVAWINWKEPDTYRPIEES